MIKSGVYRIRNIINGKLYIGSTKDFETREATHWRGLKNNIHHCQKLQRAYNKYGKEKFIFEIIYKTLCLESLIDIEQIYLDSYDFKTELYNSLPTAGSNKDKIVTDEIKAKIGAANRGKYIGNTLRKGIPHTEETRIKMRRAHINRVYKKHTDETKQKMSETAQSRAKPVQQFNKKTLECIAEFNSIASAAQHLGVKPAHICSCANGIRKTAYGFVWRFK